MTIAAWLDNIGGVTPQRKCIPTSAGCDIDKVVDEGGGKTYPCTA
jgi:hypothetical protein